MVEEILVDRFGSDEWLDLAIYVQPTVRFEKGNIPGRVVARQISATYEENGVDHRIKYDFSPAPGEIDGKSVCGDDNPINAFGTWLTQESPYQAADANLLMMDTEGGGCGGGNTATVPVRNITHDPERVIESGDGDWAQNVSACLHELGHCLGIDHNPHPGLGWNDHDREVWHRTPNNSANGVDNLCGDRIESREYNSKVSHLYFTECSYQHFEYADKPPIGEGGGIEGPTATFEYTTEGLTVHLDASKSGDPDGQIEDYAWDAGGIRAHGEQISVDFPSEGTYPIELTVWDDDGLNDTMTHDVTVQQSSGGGGDEPPVAVFDYDADGEWLDLDAGASHHPDGQIVEYNWIVDPGAIPASGETTFYQFAESGDYTVTLEVVGDGGQSDTAVATVTIQIGGSNDPPVADFGYETEPVGGETPGTIHLDASASNDPDGQIEDYRWDVGGVVVHGEQATVDVDSPGDYDVTLTVWDGGGQSDSVTATATVGGGGEPPGDGGNGRILAAAVGGAALLWVASRRET